MLGPWALRASAFERTGIARERRAGRRAGREWGGREEGGGRRYTRGRARNFNLRLMGCVWAGSEIGREMRTIYERGAVVRNEGLCRPGADTRDESCRQGS